MAQATAAVVTGQWHWAAASADASGQLAGTAASRIGRWATRGTPQREGTSFAQRTAQMSGDPRVWRVVLGHGGCRTFTGD